VAYLIAAYGLVVGTVTFYACYLARERRRYTSGAAGSE